MTIRAVPFYSSRICFGSLIIDVENTGGIIHRTGEQTHIRKRAEIIGGITLAPGVPLHATCTFTGHHIWPCAAYSGLLDRLMGINHDIIFRGSLHNFLIMTHPILGVMKVTTLEPTGISCFDSVDTE